MTELQCENVNSMQDHTVTRSVQYGEEKQRR